jgi:hypothetical protein
MDEGALVPPTRHNINALNKAPVEVDEYTLYAPEADIRKHARDADTDTSVWVTRLVHWNSFRDSRHVFFFSF